MKLLAISLCLACLPTFAQDDLPARQSDRQQQKQHTEQAMQIQQAIRAHHSFQLPGASQGSSVRFTAKSMTRSANVLRFGDVEIMTDSVIVQADALNYYWDSGEIRSYGEVSVRAIPAQ
jgi:hypothetical protein